MKEKQVIVVIAGTTESRKVIEELLNDSMKKEIIATTATALGSEMLKDYKINIREGKLTEEGFTKLFQEVQPDCVIDASHPFAVIVTKTVQSVCNKMGISYKRIEREKLEYHYEKLIRVGNIDEAISCLNERFLDDTIFLTTGSNTLKQYVERVQNGAERIYARVIDCEYSRNLCKDVSLKQDHIFYETPPFFEEDTRKVLEGKKCTVLVTKDSGKAGGVDKKIEIAKQLGVAVILIERPKEETEREKKQKTQGVMIAGTGSGCGKTTMICALMKALSNRGIALAPFKCGPDYIDPMLHRHIVGYPSNNLDAFFMEEEVLKEVFHSWKQGREFALVEGVMGFYDGIGISSVASSYEVSEQLELPVILVLSVRGMSATIGALIKGMLTYRPNRIKGVLLNQCSPVLYKKLKSFLEEEIGILVLGHLPVDSTITIQERHLGLMTAQEIENLDEIIERLGALGEQYLDLDGILKLGHYEKNLALSEDKTNLKQKIKEKKKEEITIAVASDEAFCFCYEDNLNYLKEQGGNIEKFSPLWDEELPKGINALYLPGGYPELYGEVLQRNESMRKSILQAIDAGIPVIAECGGYLYLCETLIVDEKNKEGQKKAYSMVGVIPQTIEMTGKLNIHFGYITITTNEDGVFGKKGSCFKGHEFHYSKEAKELKGCRIEKADKSRAWDGVYYTETIYAGYPHFQFRSNKEAIRNYLQKAKEVKEW